MTEQRTARIDISPGERAKAERTPENFLRVDGVLCRVGVQEYPRPDGSVVREHRPAEEVFSPAHLDSLRQKPITLGHPPGLLTAETARQYAVGSIGEPRQEGDHVVAPLLITDAAAIQAIEAGTQELSCGYTVALDPTPGEYRGERYDAVMREIRANHCALVDKARCGPTCSLRLDCAGCGGACASKPATDRERTTMATIKIGDIEIDADNRPAVQRGIDLHTELLVAKVEAVASAHADALRIATEADAKIAELTADRDRILGELDALKAANPQLAPCVDCEGTGKADGKECAGCEGAGLVPVPDAKAKADQADRRLAMRRDYEAERFALVWEAAHHLSRNDIDALAKADNDELRRRLIVAWQPKSAGTLDNARGEYLRARFDATRELIAAGPRAIDMARTASMPVAGYVFDAPDDDGEGARAVMRKRNADAFVKRSTP